MDILMPQLGETVAEGTVTSWYKQVGERVQPDEPLFDVETDKVSTEIPSPVAGVLAEILVPAGTTVKVGTRLAVLHAAGEPASVGRQTPAASPSVQPQEDRERQVAARVPLPPRADTFLTPNPSPGARGERRVPADAGGFTGSNTSVRAHPRIAGQKLSPVVRRLLAEHGIPAHAVRGTGRDGRVTREDVRAHAARLAATTGAPAARASSVVARVDPPASLTPALAMSASTSAPQADTAPGALAPGERFVPFTAVRRKTAVAMARAWSAVPHVLQAVEADFGRIDAVRRERGTAWKTREGFTLTYLPFIALAVCQALAKHERLNARIEGDGLVVSRRVHLGIAVDLDHEGLLVPVVRDAQDRTLPALAREIHRLAAAARAGRLTPDEAGTPTYTLSNSGVFGTLVTAPIVNPPQVAILSTDGVKKRAVVIESPSGDAIAVRPVGVLAQSFDHRAVDGAYSAAFLREVQRVIEIRPWEDDVPA